MTRNSIIAAVVLMLCGIGVANGENPVGVDLATTLVARTEYYIYNEDGTRWVETTFKYEYDSLGRVTRVMRNNYDGSFEESFHTYFGCIEIIEKYLNGKPFCIHRVEYQDSLFRLYEVNNSFPTYQKPLSCFTSYSTTPDESYVNEWTYDSLGREETYRWKTPTFITNAVTKYSPFRSTQTYTTVYTSGEEEIQKRICVYEDMKCTRQTREIDALDMTVVHKYKLDDFGNRLEWINCRNPGNIHNYVYKYYSDRNELYLDGRLLSVNYYVE